MIIETSRFGRVNYKKTEIVWMIRGLLGFESHKRFLIVTIDGQEPFKWLQSLDDPAVAFMIIDPLHFKNDYVFDINPREITLLGGRGGGDFIVYVIVTIPKGRTDRMSANLQGPLIINKHNMRAAQLVLGESSYETQHFIFKEIEKKMAQAPA